MAKKKSKNPLVTTKVNSAIKVYKMDEPAQLARMANVLKSHVIKHKLYTTIVGKNYAHVEGWQFAGGLLGISPRVVRVEDMSNGKVAKWFAEVELINNKDGSVVSRGFAICSKEESKKAKFDEYAILSMAQTRAIGKAYRNILGWVMKLAGYEGTPSEEMRGFHETPKPPVVNGNIKNAEFSNVDVCQKCPYGNNISKAERDYSKRLYGREMCKDCQKDAKPKRRKK